MSRIVPDLTDNTAPNKGKTVIIKVDTKILLTCISIADIAFGTHGAMTLVLWICFGLFKIFNSD